MNPARAAEYDASKSAAGSTASLPAAMLAESHEIPVGSASGAPVAAHLVLGWEDGRTSVNDMDWDDQPILGYAIQDLATGAFVLQEDAGDFLHTLSRARAVELGITGLDGRLVRHRPATVIECRSLSPYIAGYAEADCTLSDGRIKRLLIGSTNDEMPTPSGLVGKNMTESARFPTQSASR